VLKQRVITAVILAPIVIGGLFFLPPLGFAVFTALVLAVAGWEWGNLSGVTAPVQRWLCAALVLALMVVSYSLPVEPVLWVAVLWWALAWFLVASYPQRTHLWAGGWTRLLMGVPVLVGAWLGLNHLRTGELSLGQADNNLLLILYTFVIVWAADIGAYFSGRAFGRRKLAPSVSPGKSWAGVYGGLALVLVLACVIAWLVDAGPAAAAGFVLVSLVTAAVSIIGDLFISMLKRHRGIKDSSQLLPGHGGIMDRIDSLVAAIPVMAFCFTLAGWLVPAG